MPASADIGAAVSAGAGGRTSAAAGGSGFARFGRRGRRRPAHQQRRNRPVVAEAGPRRRPATGRCTGRRTGGLHCCGGFRRHRLVRIERVRSLAFLATIAARRKLVCAGRSGGTIRARSRGRAIRARRTRGTGGARTRTTGRFGAGAAFARRTALGGGRGIEAVGADHRNRLLEQLFDFVEQSFLVGGDEGDGEPGRAGASGASDAVDVVLGHVRQLVVDDQRQVVDVESARGDVGRDQHLQLAFLERVERLHPRDLALVAVDRRRGQAIALELAREARGAVLGAHEAQHLVQVAGLHQVHEQRALGVLRDLVGALRDRFGGGVALGHFDQLRLVEQLVGELLDLVRERCREQQVLPLGGHRQQRHDPLDVGNEAHVEHAVGFVEHEHLDLPEVNALVFDVVEQPPRSGDEDLDAGADDLELRLDVDAAVDDGRAQLGVPAVGLDRVLDLDREFPGRGQDQRAHRVPRRRRARVGQRGQLLQDRQRETGGLAGAGLGAAHDVVAGENDGNGLRLDRRGRGVAGFFDGPQQFGPQPELGKARSVQGSTPVAAHRVTRLPVQAACVWKQGEAGGRGTTRVATTATETRAGLGGDRNGRPNPHCSLTCGFYKIFVAGSAERRL